MRSPRPLGQADPFLAAELAAAGGVHSFSCWHERDIAVAPLLLHAGVAVTWRAWSFDPAVWLLAMVGAAAYVRKTEQIEPPRRARYWLPFFCGVFVALAALVSPLDAAAGHMLSLHMFQHLLLSTVAAPLLVLGMPAELTAELLRGRRLQWLSRRIAVPWVTAPIFIVDMWVWHIPPLYEQALLHSGVHALMHISFLLTGILFWWPVFQETPGVPRLTIGGRLLYVFASGFPMELLALMFIAGTTSFYHYYDLPPYLFGVSPLIDQQISGIVMGSVGEATSLVTISFYFLMLDRDDSPRARQAGRSAALPPLASALSWILVAAFVLFAGIAFGLSLPRAGL